MRPCEACNRLKFRARYCDTNICVIVSIFYLQTCRLDNFVNIRRDRILYSAYYLQGVLAEILGILVPLEIGVRRRQLLDSDEHFTQTINNPFYEIRICFILELFFMFKFEAFLPLLCNLFNPYNARM